MDSFVLVIITEHCHDDVCLSLGVKALVTLKVVLGVLGLLKLAVFLLFLLLFAFFIEAVLTEVFVLLVFVCMAFIFFKFADLVADWFAYLSADGLG